jgi:hypothetical protein
VNTASAISQPIRARRASAVLALLGAVVAVTFSVLFYRATSINYYMLQLDSAYLVEIVDSTYSTGVPRTYLTKSVIAAIGTVLVAPPDRVCAQQFGGDEGPPMNVYRWHAFPILHILAALRLLLSAEHIVFLMQVLAFPGLLLAVYWAARREGVGVLCALALMVLTAAHPAWSYASFGQFYPDKYFILFGFLAAYFVYCRLEGARSNTTALVVFCLFAAATSERSAIMLSAFTLGALVLWQISTRRRRIDWLLLGLATGLLLYAVSYMALWQSNPNYNSFSDQAYLMLTGRIPVPSSVWKFLWCNVALFGVLAIAEWRLALLMLFALTPNVFGSLGGAEKLGWSTHYHSTYFPFLVVAVIAGCARLYASDRSHVWRAGTALAATGLAVLQLFSNPFTATPVVDMSSARIWDTGLVKTIELAIDIGPAGYLQTVSRSRRGLGDAVPPNVSVTTVEGYMPALQGHGRRLNFYPLALDAADYAVLRYTSAYDGTRRYRGAVSYLGREAEEAIDDCLAARLAGQYQLVADIPIPGLPTAILRRRQLTGPRQSGPAGLSINTGQSATVRHLLHLPLFFEQGAVLVDDLPIGLFIQPSEVGRALPRRPEPLRDGPGDEPNLRELLSHDRHLMSPSK